MQAIGFVLFLALGLFQMAATYSGLTDWLGLHWMLAALIMLILGWSPVIGTIIGIFGAIYAWRWPAWQAIALMGGPMLVFLGIASAAGLIDAWQNRRQRVD